MVRFCLAHSGEEEDLAIRKVAVLRRKAVATPTTKRTDCTLEEEAIMVTTEDHVPITMESVNPIRTTSTPTKPTVLSTIMGKMQPGTHQLKDIIQPFRLLNIYPYNLSLPLTLMEVPAFRLKDRTPAICISFLIHLLNQRPTGYWAKLSST